MDYNKRLEVSEIEGDLLKALLAKNLAKVEVLHKKLGQAKLALHLADQNNQGNQFFPSLFILVGGLFMKGMILIKIALCLLLVSPFFWDRGLA